MNFKDKTALIIDFSGENLEHAVTHAKEYKHVYYYTSWEADHSFRDRAVGMGMAKNITKVEEYWHYMDTADLIAYVDIGGEGEAHYLKTHKRPDGSSYPLYGAGLGERLERERAASHKIQEAIGLKSPPFTSVKGVKALRDHFSSNPDEYVKSDTTTRADLETWHAFHPEAIEIMLNNIEAGSGPYKEDREFLVEKAIKADMEVGFDAFFSGHQFLRPIMWGVERGRPYAGKFSDKLPDYMEEYITKISSILRDLDYRGAISTEFRDEFCCDLTCRFPSPLGIIHTKALENYCDVIWACAHKQIVKLRPASKYVLGCNIKCDYGDEHWLPLLIPKEYKDNVTLFGACRKGELDYIVPGQSGQIYIVVFGESIDKLYDQVAKIAESIEGHEIDASPLYHLSKAIADVKKIEGF